MAALDGVLQLHAARDSTSCRQITVCTPGGCVVTCSFVARRDAVADHMVHESFECDTRDHEDHTFCGVMFNVACKVSLPAEYIEIASISVRGQLGPLTVWKTDDSFYGKHEDENEWEKIYDATHEPSPDEMVELKFDVPLRLHPGMQCGLYVHSALPGDEAIVYDDARDVFTYDDDLFTVLPGLAHLSNRPFGRRGFWGRPWRTHREFVGKVNYGVRWRMWSPKTHLDFPIAFQKSAEIMLMASRRPESLMYLLQDEIVFFIMNKIMWDAWGREMPSRRNSKARAGGATEASRHVGPCGLHFSGSSSRELTSCQLWRIPGLGHFLGAPPRQEGSESDGSDSADSYRFVYTLDVGAIGGEEFDQDIEDESEDEEDDEFDDEDDDEYDEDNEEDDDEDDEEDDEDDEEETIQEVGEEISAHHQSMLRCIFSSGHDNSLSVEPSALGEGSVHVPSTPCDGSFISLPSSNPLDDATHE